MQKSIIRKPISILLSLLLVLSVFGGMAFTASAVATGTFGDATWTLDDDGLLTVSGTGLFSPRGGDWFNNVSPQVKSVVIGDGISGISKIAFEYCSNMESVEIGNGITEILPEVFENTSNLTSVKLGKNVRSIGSNNDSFTNLLTQTVADETGYTVSVEGFLKGTGNYAGQMFKAVVKKNGEVVPGPFLMKWSVGASNSNVSYYDFRASRPTPYFATTNDPNYNYGPYGYADSRIHTMKCDVFRVTEDGKGIEKLCSGSKSGLINYNDNQSSWTNNELKNSTDFISTILFVGNTSDNLKYTIGKAGFAHVDCDKVYITFTNNLSQAAQQVLRVENSNYGRFKAIAPGIADVTYTIYTAGCEAHQTQYTAASPLRAGVRYIVLNKPTVEPETKSLTFNFPELPDLGDNELTITLNGETKTVPIDSGRVTFTGLNPETNYPYTLLAGNVDRGYAYAEDNAVTLPAPPHDHSFTYAADAATLTATCQNADCDLPDGAVSFTINAPAKTRYSDGKSAAATLTGVDVFNEATLKTVSAADIVYFKGDQQLDAAPENAGTYQARITVEGATAVVEYTIAKTNTFVFVPGTRNATYGDTLDDVTLPDDANGVWTWKDDLTTSVGNAGVKTFTAVYTPNNENYNTMEVAVTVNVAKANPDYQIPANLTATVGDTLADVTLPDGWAWQDSTEPVGAVGEKTFKATFTPADIENYNIVENIDVPVTVGKAIPVYTVPTGLTATYGDTLADVTLPDDENGVWTLKEDNTTSVGNAGENRFIAVFTPNDPDCAVVEVPVTITVGKANPSFDVPTGLTATEGDTLADVTLPEGWSWKDDSESVGEAGEKTFKATFTPDDTANYNVVENIDVPVTVSAKTPDTPETPDTPDTPANGDFRCGFCDEYEYWKDTIVIGWFVSLIHIFVHLAAHIGHIT